MLLHGNPVYTLTTTDLAKLTLVTNIQFDGSTNCECWCHLLTKYKNKLECWVILEHYYLSPNLVTLGTEFCRRTGTKFILNGYTSYYKL